MIKLKALAFQTDARQDIKSLQERFKSEYHTSEDRSPFSIELQDASLSLEDWKSVPLVRDAADHLPEEKAREVRLRQRKAQKFWTATMPESEGTTDYFTCLTADFRQWKKGCLVFERVIVDGGGILFFLDYLQLNPDSLEVSVSPGPIPAKALLHASDIGISEIGSEAMSVLSLVGMTLITSQPELGVAMMIGGQVFSFLFGHMGGGGEKKPLPSAEMIMKGLSSIVADESIKQLSGEANSVWDDIHQKYNQSWELGLEPSKTDLKDFEGILDRAVGLSKIGSVHDNVNKIHARIAESKDDNGNHTGLHWVPAYIWSATVEVYGLELRHNLYYAWSDGGVGDDAPMNERYENALKNWHQRVGELHGCLAKLAEEANGIAANRLSAISNVQIKIIPEGWRPPRTVSSGPGTMYYFEDHGSWPAVTRDNPVYFEVYHSVRGCCDSHDFDRKAAEEAANKAHADYVDNIRKSVFSLIGMSNTELVATAVSKWNGSAALAAKLIDDLQKLKKNHKRAA